MSASDGQIFHLRVLGATELRAGGEDGQVVLRNAKPVALLAYLSLTPGRKARRQYLADLLWPELEPDRARGALRQALYYLSTKSSSDILESEEQSIRIRAGRLSTDVWEFQTAIEEGRYESAIAVYGGSLLEGFEGKGGKEFDRWVEAQDQGLREGFRAACSEAIRETREKGEPEAAATIAHELVELNPLDEVSQARLIGTLLEAGNPIAAYQAYESYRVLLREELGSEPSESLQNRMTELQGRLHPGVPRDSSTGTRNASRDATVVWGDSTERRVSGPGERDRRRWIGTAAGSIIGVLLLGAFLQFRPGSPPATAWESVEASLAVVLSGSSSSSIRLVIDEGEVRQEGPVSSPMSVVSPSGEAVAFRRGSESGAGIVVRNTRSGVERSLTGGAADEIPVDWSPDGRWLLFKSGRPDEDSTEFEAHFGVLDVETRTRRRLAAVSGGGVDPWAAWSPAGPLVAYDDGEGGVHVVHFDGSRSVRLTSDEDEAGQPSWSPAGDWLAFTSRRSGSSDVYVIRSDGRGLRRLTFAPTDEVSPVWLSDRHVSFVSRDENGGDLWAVNLLTRRTRRLTRGLRAVRMRRIDSRPHDFLEDFEIEPTDRLRLLPGEEVRVSASGTTEAGSTLSRDALGIRWKISPDSVATVDEEGLVRGLRPGRAALVATAGGWRSDSLIVEVAPVTRRPIAPEFVESWEEGIDPRRWVVLGQPRPLVTRVAGPAAQPTNVMINNGDQNYASGVISRSGFDLSKGLTVVWDARLPFTGRLYEAVVVGFLDSIEPDSLRWDRGTREYPALFMSGEEPMAIIQNLGRDYRLPWPEDVDSWNEYALQIAEDGRVKWFIDRKLAWSSATPVLKKEGRRPHLTLFGRSLNTRLMVDEVRVYLGELFVPLASDEGSP